MEKTPEWLSKLRGEIVALKKQQDVLYQELMDPPDMKPGSLSVQYKKCGKPNCKCMRKENPEKHGPYYYRITCVSGKTVLRYVRDRDEREAIQRYEIYETLIRQYQEVQLKITNCFEAMKRRRAGGR